MREVVYDVVGSARSASTSAERSSSIAAMSASLSSSLTAASSACVASAPSTAATSASRLASGDRSADTREHRLPNRRRHVEVLDVPSRPTLHAPREAVRSAPAHDRFVDEERVAARPAVKSLGEIRDSRAFGAKSLLEQRHHVVDAERLEPESLRALEPAQRTLRAAERRVPAQIRIVVRPDEQHALAADLSRDEVQHLERRAVRPLQVLEHEQQRLLRRKAGEQLREIPEDARLQLGRIAARRRERTIGVPPPNAGKSCASSAVPPRVSSMRTDGSMPRSSGINASENTAYGTPVSTG